MTGSLAEQISLPCFLIASQHPMFRVDADLGWLPGESHARFLWCAIALPVIAREARRDKIVPGRFTSPWARHDVIQRQPGRRKPEAAILAHVAVSKQNPFAWDGAILARYSTVLLQPHDARNWKCDLRSPHWVCRHFLHDRRAVSAYLPKLVPGWRIELHWSSL
jgi:hypothetical protein